MKMCHIYKYDEMQSLFDTSLQFMLFKDYMQINSSYALQVPSERKLTNLLQFNFAG